jgi:hypothetical protein
MAKKAKKESAAENVTDLELQIERLATSIVAAIIYSSAAADGHNDIEKAVANAETLISKVSGV